MPAEGRGSFPALLSETGAFKDTGKLIANDGLIPYEINVPFWSDGAAKRRWMSLPADANGVTSKIRFQPDGEWKFPAGTVFVKHFDFPLDDTHPGKTRRLETRLLVLDSKGSVYGVTYKWRADNSDAELLSSNVFEEVLIKTGTGVRTQKWYYPSRQDCRTCHTDQSGLVLGVKTRQINRNCRSPDGATTNQMLEWNREGLFDPSMNPAELPRLARLAPPDDLSRSLEERARSYLDANCANCHRPGGTVAEFDVRYDVPLAKQKLIDGPVLIDEGLDNARVIAPNDTWRSIALLRVNSLEGNKMPPLAHYRWDEHGAALLREWIESLPGPKVLAPPAFSKPAGKYSGPVELALNCSEAGARVHYTLDGSAPGSNDPVYGGPIKITEPTTVRARAYKKGCTRSIVVAATYIIQ